MLLPLLTALVLAVQPSAGKPLYRDPVHDGAADAALVQESASGRWLMFYTNRRATLLGIGDKDVSWVHGTHIAVAESADGGHNWRYRGVADLPAGAPTQWAPEIVTHAGVHHIFLSVVPGVFKDWNAPRHIVHLTSRDLKRWRFVSRLELGSDRVIDAAVLRLPSGVWRLWYKDERDGSRIRYAESRDLNTWKPVAVAIAGPAGEGPKVFFWKGRYWILIDHWNGLGVYGSPDADHWTAQPGRLLAGPGLARTDRSKGQHADVVVAQGRAFLFYFVHQENEPEVVADPTWRRRSVIQVAELTERDGVISVNRDAPAAVSLMAAPNQRRPR